MLLFVTFFNISNTRLYPIVHTSALIEFSKWRHLLPIRYQCSVLKEKYFDFDGAKDFLEHIQLITYN